MVTGKRKREVAACIPCYTRKQKCDRQYPCDRCNRRRQPELCAYYATHPRTITEKSCDEVEAIEPGDEGEPLDSSLPPANSRVRTGPEVVPVSASSSSTLAEAFGYYGPSDFNTMALVRKLLPHENNHDATEIPLPADMEAEVRKTLQTMLPRPVIDVLVRYFVAEVNWIYELLHPPWFLAQYQRWWNSESISSVAGVEFAILFLRVCCHASLFLPSPSHPIDSVKGVSLARIRKSCEEVIDILLPICRQLDPRGSLVRVQHIAFAGLVSIGNEPMDAFWEHVGSASRVAQQIGLHLDSSLWPESMDGIEKEMRRRVFCNLYVWDSCLSKRLHRLPFLPDDAISDDILPRMRLLREPDMGTEVPDVFTERLLRAQLARFLRNHTPKRGPGPENNKYDAVAAEERYEAFCSVFLPTIPPAFALAQPERRWDARLATLPKQRQLLHMALFEWLCWNYRPTLLQPADGNVPGYKRVLVSHGKRALAAAALGLVESVSALHGLMGGSQMRFPGIISPLFEGAVPLVCLCADPGFPGAREEDREPRPGPQSQSLEAVTKRMRSDPLGARMNSVTRAECMQAARGALATLQILAEVSEMAQVGAQTLSRLINTVDSSSSSSSSNIATSPPTAPLASNHADAASLGGPGQRDAATPRPQPAISAISQWAYDPETQPAGSMGYYPNFSFPEGDIGMSMGGPVGPDGWEVFFRDFTGGFGL